jgi:methylated-DNA-[protein]-cysteine S-methyltransferase
MTDVEKLLGRLGPAVDDDEAHVVDRMRTRLVARAADEGLIDVAYRTLDTPVGSLLLAGTPSGLVRIAYAKEGHDQVLEELAERISPRVLRAPARLDPVARELDEYFTRQRRLFDLPLDWRLARGFRRTVLGHLLEIEYGSTASYSAIAAATGSPRAMRAVGTACATNPLAVVVPCHRVVRSDGSLGGYGGGLDAKRLLLDLEATP